MNRANMPAEYLHNQQAVLQLTCPNNRPANIKIDNRLNGDAILSVNAIFSANKK